MIPILLKTETLIFVVEIFICMLLTIYNESLIYFLLTSFFYISILLVSLDEARRAHGQTPGVPSRPKETCHGLRLL